MFSVTNLNIGPMQPHASMEVVFPYKDIEIKEWKASCGCAQPKDDKDNKQFKVTFTAKEFPEHLKQLGHTTFKTTKTIDVVYYVANDPHKMPLSVILQFTALVELPKRRK